MFSVTKIASLYGAVGVRQPFNAAYAIIDAANQVSNSGLFATDNPLCKVEYLKDTQDYADISDTDFNTFVKRMQEDSIMSVARAVFNESDYIDRQVLYPFAQNKVNTITLPSGFVGERIEVSIEKNVAFEISRIMLDFDGAGDVEILLFNTAQSTPIESQVVTIASNHQSVDLGWKVDNSGDTYKGEYYLGYLTNTVGFGTLKPYARDYDNSNIRAEISLLELTQVQFVGHTTATIPDLRTDEGMSDSHGMNPDITVYDDFTDLILRNETLFYQAINLEFQIKFLDTYLNSLRRNGNEMKSDLKSMKMMIELNGTSKDDQVKVVGLRSKLNGSISTIKKEVERLRSGYFGGRIQVYTMT
tara:strand:+ start:1289 stop:2365 length:1077 start_codon:yes stop_codon:yes gene_type:complete